MTSSDGSHYTRELNEELRAELISASRRTERLVAASEEFFEKRERFREHFAHVTVSAGIEPDLGLVKVAGDRRITIELDHAKVAVSDPSRLGDRILAALAEAERKIAEAAAEGLGEAADL
jgi:DNA-binding protein YbaB